MSTSALLMGQNWIDQYLSQARSMDDMEHYSVASHIGRSFAWEDTAQGMRIWRNRYDKFFMTTGYILTR